MAPEKDPQQFIDASRAKRKGKEIAEPVTKKIKDEILARSKSVADIEDEEVQQVDTDSSSESDIEFVAEDLDPWKRAALQYYQEEQSTQSTGWRKWTVQELAMIEIEVLASRVPNPEELPDEDAYEEFVFDFDTPDDQEALDEEDEIADPDTTEAVPDPQITEQVIEDSDSAQPPQEPQDIAQADPSADGAAMVDASGVAADPSSSSIPSTK